MKWLAADLHVHSVLSPCGDLCMSPRAIVARAAEIGLDVVAIADHNAAGNAPALRDTAVAAGVMALFGLEVRTAEEVDVLTIFDGPEAAEEFGAWVYAALPEVACAPELYGDQVVVDAADEILAVEPRLLINATGHSLESVCDEAHRRGALVIPAHVDRPSDSVISQLGWLPDDLAVDAVELSKFGDESALAGEHPWLRAVPVVRFSDAHRLAEIGSQQTRFRVREATVEEFRAALSQGGGRRVQPVRRALFKEQG